MTIMLLPEIVLFALLFIIFGDPKKYFTSVLDVSMLWIFVAYFALISILLIVFYVYLLRLYYYSYAIVVDSCKAIESLKMSWRISKGNVLRTLVVLVVFIIAAASVNLVFSIFEFVGVNRGITYIISSPFLAFVYAWRVSSFLCAYMQMSESSDDVEI
jgi:hypothetical protein